MLKKYKFGVDAYAAVLFLLIMLPNFVWFAFPAPNDILRSASQTPLLDAAASLLQTIMVALMCLLKRRDAAAVRLSSGWVLSAGSFCLCYYAVWLAYYRGHVGAAVILGQCIFPSLSFAAYQLDRRNWPALLVLVLFTLLHLASGIINHIA